MVSHLNFGNIQTLTNVVGPGGAHDHGLKAGRHIHLQLCDGKKLGPVLIGPGEMTDQILQCKNIQSGELFGLGGAYAF